MSGKRYTEEFKVAAVKQAVERGHPSVEVAERLAVSIHRIYAWTKRYGVPEERCGINRVHRIMRSACLRSQTE